jgi:transposase
VASLLHLSAKLDVVSIINRHICSCRPYWPEKPIRNNLTAGITLLLAAIGRVCMPTSKRGWWQWAQNTSCEYLLRCSLCRVDSQHFWDMMDCLPQDQIDDVELEVLRNVQKSFPFHSDTLLYDTTNFYTFIDSANTRCDIAQRGKNKQKRNDLRQVGLALLVTAQDYIPLLHHTYRGNFCDCSVFTGLLPRIKRRLRNLGLNIKNHTLVFDRGCNSKANLARIRRSKLHFLGALTPAEHSKIIADAESAFSPLTLDDNTSVLHYRDKRLFWGQQTTILVYISEKLKAGQLHGIYQTLDRKKRSLRKIQRSLANPRTKKRSLQELTNRIDTLLSGQFINGLISYRLTESLSGRFNLSYRTNTKALGELEDRLGFRILMTDRHDWNSARIIKTYHGQSVVESAFKNIKNPYHLAITPEFHWTDQKIRIHYFSCVLGYLLAALLWRQARREASFTGTLDSLLDILNNIRLATLIESTGKRGKPKAVRQLEDITPAQMSLANAFDLQNLHSKKLNINGLSVYN